MADPPLCRRASSLTPMRTRRGAAAIGMFDDLLTLLSVEGACASITSREAFLLLGEGARIRFANPAALVRLGDASMWEAQEGGPGSASPSASPLRRALGRVSPPRSGTALTRLRIDPLRPPETARCGRVHADAGERLTVVTLAPVGQEPDDEAVLRAFAARQVSAAILDPRGRVLAGDGLDWADERDFSDLPVVEAPSSVTVEMSGGSREGLLAVLDDERRLLLVQEGRTVSRGEGSSPHDILEDAGVPGDEPVRFLWQTDEADRFVFVSAGLVRIAGPGADVTGESWGAASARLGLDPSGAIARALASRDTWSGLVAHWPTDKGEERVPAELTALPVFGADGSFQGFHGFGVLRPGETRGDETEEDIETLGVAGISAGALGPVEAPTLRERRRCRAVPAGNVVPLHQEEQEPEPRRLRSKAAPGRPDAEGLSPGERDAFSAIAEALGARYEGSEPRLPLPEPLTARRPEARSAHEDDVPARPDAEPSCGRPIRFPDFWCDDDRRADPVAASAFAPARSAADVAVHAEPEADAPQGPTLHDLLEALGAPLLFAHRTGRIFAANAAARTLLEWEGAPPEDATLDALVGSGATETLWGDARDLAFEHRDRQLVARVDLRAGEEVWLSLQDRTREAVLTQAVAEAREKAASSAARDEEALTATRRNQHRARMASVALQDARSAAREAERLLHGERRRANEATDRADAAERRHADLLARLSHDVRAPLSAVIGFSEVMIDERFGPLQNARYLDYLRDVRASGEHVLRLVESLVEVSRLEAGEVELDPQSLSLNTLVEAGISHLQSEVARGRIIFRTSLADDLPLVRCDTRSAEHIVADVIAGAVRFTRPGGQVIVSTRPGEGGAAVLRVRTAGDAPALGQDAGIVDPFQDFGSSSGRHGLQPTLTQALAKANGAEITLEEFDGEGAISRIVFAAACPVEPVRLAG